MATQLFLVEDHPLVREGIKHIISSGTEFAVVAEAADGEQALSLLRSTPCDIVVLDISLPKTDGIEVLRQIRMEMPQKPVLVLSIHAEDEYAVRALRAGAVGYVTKDALPSDLLAALRKVAHGGRYTSPALAEKIALGMLHHQDRSDVERLSAREYQILSMISWGKTVTEIANDLKLSVKTVSTYRARLLEKLSLRNNGELTRYAIRNNISAPRSEETVLPHSLGGG